MGDDGIILEVINIFLLFSFESSGVYMLIGWEYFFCSLIFLDRL